jgi:flagellar hook-length control protein FliK
MLLRQGGGGLSANGASESGGRAFNPTPDNPAAQLLAKVDLPVEGAGFKPALVAGELPAGLLKGDGQTTATPLSAVASGLEQLSARRSEVFTPPAIQLPTGTKGWDNLLSNRVMWMVGNQLQQASVHITPRHLGPIDIQVSIQNDQTSVSFLAQNAAVKEALEAAIPRLREMFADSNLQLVNVDVGQRDSGDRASGADLFQQAATGDGNNFSIPGQGGGDDDNAQAQIDPVGTLTSSALVDDYA